MGFFSSLLLKRQGHWRLSLLLSNGHIIWNSSQLQGTYSQKKLLYTYLSHPGRQAGEEKAPIYWGFGIFMHTNLLLKYDAPPLTHYSHSSLAIIWKGMLEEPCSMKITSKLKDGLMLLSLFASNFIFLLSQTCCFFLPFWGKETAVANRRETPQSQVAVCYSRN